MDHRLYHIPMVEAVLTSPIREEEGKEKISRFTRSFYVWARDEADAMALVKDSIVVDAILITCDEAVERTINEVPKKLRPMVALDTRRGIAWRSGRVFFQEHE